MNIVSRDQLERINREFETTLDFLEIGFARQSSSKIRTLLLALLFPSIDKRNLERRKEKKERLIFPCKFSNRINIIELILHQNNIQIFSNALRAYVHLSTSGSRNVALKKKKRKKKIRRENDPSLKLFVKFKKMMCMM